MTVDTQQAPGWDRLRKRIISLPTLAAVVAAVALLALALWRVFDFEWGDVWANIRSIHPWQYLAALLVYYASFWARGLRWRLIAKTAGMEKEPGVKVPRAFTLAGVILMGWFANSVAFFRLGDAYRGWGFSRESGAGFASSLGTVVAERVQDMATVVMLLAVAAVLLGLSNERVPFAVVVVALGLALALVVMLVLMRRFGLRIAGRLPGRVQRVYENFQSGTLRSFRPRDLPLQVLLGIIGWLLEVARFYLVADAMGVELSFGIVMFAALANAMLSTIPTPGGFGFVEAGLTGLLVYLGVPHADALALTVMDRLISWVSVIIFGGLLFAYWHRLRPPTVILVPKARESSS